MTIWAIWSDAFYRNFNRHVEIEAATVESAIEAFIRSEEEEDERLTIRKGECPEVRTMVVDPYTGAPRHGTIKRFFVTLEHKVRECKKGER